MEVLILPGDPLVQLGNLLILLFLVLRKISMLIVLLSKNILENCLLLGEFALQVAEFHGLLVKYGIVVVKFFGVELVEGLHLLVALLTVLDLGLEFYFLLGVKFLCFDPGGLEVPHIIFLVGLPLHFVGLLRLHVAVHVLLCLLQEIIVHVFSLLGEVVFYVVQLFDGEIAQLHELGTHGVSNLVDLLLHNLHLLIVLGVLGHKLVLELAD